MEEEREGEWMFVGDGSVGNGVRMHIRTHIRYPGG